MKIDRTLFWFKDGEKSLIELNERFFAYGILMNRLLNERYDGKKILYINIDFATEKTYELFPNLPKNDVYYYGGHLRYYGILNTNELKQYNYDEQNKYIWDRACEYMKTASRSLKNPKLLNSCEYTAKKGLELDLNPDYRMVEKDVVLFGQFLKASIWVNFRKDGMYSKFTLEKQGKIVFEKLIDKTKNGVEFFLEIYKDIDVVGDFIIIQGSKEVKYLPFKIHIPQRIF